MITAKDGTTITFKRLDQWVCSMVIDQACPHRGKCASNIVVAIDGIVSELAALEYPNQNEPKKGARKNEA